MNQQLTRKLLPLLLFCFSLSAIAQQGPRPEAVLLRGPYLQAASSNSIVIRWRTDVLIRGYVRYGIAPDQLDQTAQDSDLVSEHKILLKGLQPSTKYYYSIGSWKDKLQSGPGNYFVTLPIPGAIGLYRVGVIGDCGNNSINQRTVRDQFVHFIGDSGLTSWILLGDNAYYTGRDAEFQSNFFNIYKDNLLPKYPMYPSPGNHDYYDGDSAEEKVQKTHHVAYYQNFTMPANGEAGGIASHSPSYYSFDIGNIHFLSLDSYGIEEDQYRLYDTASPQVQWVKEDLQANKNKGWVIAYWHHPPYTMGSHNSDKEQELVHIRENFIQILERYGVDLVLCGHSHDYERSHLIKGHYGPEASFNPAVNILNGSSALYDGSPNSCPFIKDSANGYQGTVYVVSGSAGQLGGKQTSFPHDALPYADADHGGAGMLEIQGNRLDWKWVCADGVIRDHFTMMKQVNRHETLHIKKGEKITLSASFTGEYKWSTGATNKDVEVSPSSTTTYTVKDTYGCLKDTYKIEVGR